jgi:hypothetical protein
MHMRLSYSAAAVFAMTTAFAQAPIADAVDWLPVTDSERQTNAPSVDKDAGVEALFWRVHVTDETQGDGVQRVYYQYVRLKIFNEKGKEKAATIEIPLDKDVGILFLTGRTIKPDGSVVELKKDAIFEREVVRTGGIRRRVKSFAMPGVEPGAIVEYRWKEIHWTGRYFSTYIRMPLQREYPVRKVTYFIKPLPSELTEGGLTMALTAYNCQPSPLKLENSGFNSLTLENVPAFQEEPFAPSSPNLQPWALAFYYDGKKRQQDEYWNDVGRKAYQRMTLMLRADSEMKKAALEATTGAGSDEEKVLRLLRYLRAHLANLWDPGVDEAARNKILAGFSKNRSRTTAEVFRSGLGTADEMNAVFASMASAVRLEARPALVANWNDRAFDPSVTNKYFLDSVDMAVKLGDQWRLFDVSTRRLPPDMLSWQEQGVYALVSDPKKPVFIQTPVSPPEASETKRDARLKLSADGAIEGDVDESFTGHEALDNREVLEGVSAERRQEIIKDRVRQVFSNAEVSDVKVENVEDATLPVKFHYHVKVENYAQRTDKRILFQPLFFEQGVAPRFTATQRRYPIAFHHAWKEMESVSIALPQGFALDNANDPGGLNFGAPGEYKLKLSVRGQSELVAERELTFGKQGIFFFESKAYAQLKVVFDEIHRRDNHTISLKLVELSE